MTSRIYKILENYSTESADTIFTDKSIAAGYHGKLDTSTTVQYVLTDFAGYIVMQATLVENPGPDDWSDIITSELSADDSSTSAPSFVSSFTGNFVWIRAKYRLDNGIIQEISYIH
jgi:hypothetical protein